MNKIYEISDSEFRSLIENSLNISEVLFKLGCTTKGNSWGYSQVKQRMLDLNIEPWQFKGKSVFKTPKIIIDPKKLLGENCKHTRAVLRRYIIKNNLLPYKCAICNITEWNGKTLSLEIDHINGRNNDNRLENLRFLCPNCHSQTTTYGSRNQKLNESKYEITEDVKKLIFEEYHKVYSKKKVSINLNIRRSIVDRVINEFGLGKLNQRYVIRYDKDMNEIMHFGSIAEACNYLIDNNEVNTRRYKTCRATFLRNHSTFWKNSYWRILDA